MISFPRSALFSTLFFGFTCGSALADFEKGVAAYQAGNLPAAYKEFRESADGGHADSQCNVAIMLEQGIGVEKNEAQAMEWYGKSALQGNMTARFNLGVMYENGRGTAVNFTKANEWYRKAAVQGDTMAIGNLGMLYLRGDGVKVNKVAALALLLLSVTLDPSPDNFAKRNITATRGLTPDLIKQAQALSDELGGAKNLLVPLDAYLAKVEKP